MIRLNYSTANRDGGKRTKMKREIRRSLNAHKMNTKARAHAHLKERLCLPEWYGNNLDALQDCLGGINEPTRIIVRFTPQLEDSLDEYGTKLLRVLRRSTEENDNLRLTLRNWL